MNVPKEENGDEWLWKKLKNAHTKSWKAEEGLSDGSKKDIKYKANEKFKMFNTLCEMMRFTKHDILWKCVTKSEKSIT